MVNNAVIPNLEYKVGIPFAQNGAKSAVPQTSGDGSVSYDQGYTASYDLPPADGGRFIERTKLNQLLYNAYAAIKELQDLVLQAGIPVNSDNIIGTLGIESGGTGASDADTAYNNLGGGALGKLNNIAITDKKITGNLPTTRLSGTITNAQLAGSIAYSKLKGVMPYPLSRNEYTTQSSNDFMLGRMVVGFSVKGQRPLYIPSGGTWLMWSVGIFRGGMLYQDYITGGIGIIYEGGYRLDNTILGGAAVTSQDSFFCAIQKIA